MTEQTQDAAMASPEDARIDQAVARGGAYEVLRRRLLEQGTRLRALAESLNTRRLAEFGNSRMEVIGRFRIRTENNCVGRDIVQIPGDQVLFGYNVYIGLKSQTRIEDVFGLYRLVEAATPGPDGRLTLRSQGAVFALED